MKHIEINIELFKSGDNDTFRRLFDLYYDSVSSVVVGIIRQMKLDCCAGDIISETFYQLFTHRDRMHTIDHIRKFLFVVSKNKIMDVNRATKKRVRFNKEYLYIEGSGALEISPVASERVELYDYVKTILMRHELGYNTSMVLLWHYYYGLSTKEMAARLKVTEKNVNNLKMNGLHRLRYILKVTSYKAKTNVAYRQKRVSFCNTGQIFDSISEAARITGVSASCIRHAIKNKLSVKNEMMFAYVQ